MRPRGLPILLVAVAAFLVATVIASGAHPGARHAHGEDGGAFEIRTTPRGLPELVRAGPPPDPLTPVDKQHAIPTRGEPDDLVTLDGRLVAPGFEGQRLRFEAARALERLVAAGLSEGYDFRARSTFRSYDTQVQTYAYWVALMGEAEASRVSAVPGHSEHQLGTTVDLTTSEVGWELSERLDLTRAGRWLLTHAWRFGFALSYPRDAEATTGYVHEPWHYRYIGVAEARRWADSGLTLGVYLEQQAVQERTGGAGASGLSSTSQ